MLSNRPLLCCRKNLRRVSGRAFCNFSSVGANVAGNPRQWESPRQRTSPVLVGSTSLNRRSGDCHTGLSLARTSVVLAHEQFNPEQCSITSRELRAIVSRSPVREVTRPMVETAMDVFEDLWQLSHITPSYVAGGFSAAGTTSIAQVFGLTPLQLRI
jgi:hypothetical protein